MVSVHLTCVSLTNKPHTGPRRNELPCPWYNYVSICHGWLIAQLAILSEIVYYMQLKHNEFLLVSDAAAEPAGPRLDVGGVPAGDLVAAAAQRAVPRRQPALPLLPLRPRLPRATHLPMQIALQQGQWMMLISLLGTTM